MLSCMATASERSRRLSTLAIIGQLRKLSSPRRIVIFSSFYFKEVPALPVLMFAIAPYALPLFVYIFACIFDFVVARGE